MLRPFILKRLHAERSGIAATEFAFLAPVLIVIMLGASELSSAIIASNRANYFADALGGIVSRVRVTLSEADLKQLAVSAILSDTDLVNYAAANRLALDKAFKATITSIAFTQKKAECQKDCEYQANVVFSYTLNGINRACGPLVQAAPDKQTMKTLPPDVYGPGSLVVVDIETRYQPLVQYKLGTEVTFRRTVYFRPRYLLRVNSTFNCKGYET